MQPIAFDNSFARLGEPFFKHQNPTAVPAPSLIALNTSLASQLQLDSNALSGETGVAMLAGNYLPEGAEPISTVYAGHQFGGFAPQLGDGRAVLLGEILDTSGARFDVQLKGAGRTPFSRQGDGRSPIGPVLREYLVSEAMHAMGIPTTRALAAVRTGAEVFRESVLPGAILTRVASSHIRVGTFQYFAARQELDAIKQLAMHVIHRHYPETAENDNPFLSLLQKVCNAQAELVAHWQSVGFIHGVMNTDNASIAGITIDYGPCAFLDEYDPEKVYSSIDYAGRYAFKNQPGIAQWNCANFAQCLLPWIDSDNEKAIAMAQQVIDQFPEHYTNAYLNRFCHKIGLQQVRENDEDLIGSLLTLMTDEKADFTVLFRALANGNKHSVASMLGDSSAFEDWQKKWQIRLVQEGTSKAEQQTLMKSVNPAYIPRNHLIQNVIDHAITGDDAPFDEMLLVITNPFVEQSEHVRYSMPPTDNEAVLATFCGT